MTASKPESSAPAPRAHILDPVERTSEIIFGLIIALSFTGTLSVAAEGRQELRILLLAALGANAAWGIVDGVMYVVNSLLNRNRARIQLLAIRRCPDPEAGRQLLADGLLASVAAHLRPEDLERARLGILSVATNPPRPSVTGREIIGAVGVFLLVFLSILPVALPFALIHDPGVALRTSNAVAMAMLYLAGHRLGKFGGFAPWRTGLAMLAVGGMLVLITLALGG